MQDDLLMDDETHFHWHGTVNKQKVCGSSAANPHELHYLPLYAQKVTLWCSVWSRGVIEPYFFGDEDGQAITVISQPHTEMINEFLGPKFPPNHNLWSQQNDATTNTTVISMAALHLFFRSGRFVVALMCYGLLLRQT
jgi:hypothetical protein